MTAPTQVHFIVSARDLPSKQRGPQGSTFPDPFVQVSFKNGPTQQGWNDLGKTERFNNTENPDFLQVFTADWFQGLGQVLKFDVLDYDTFNKDDLVGTVNLDLDTFAQGTNDAVLTLNKGGKLLVSRTVPLGINLGVKKLPALDNLACGIDAFVECYWSYGVDGEKHQFHKTKIQKNVHEADWDEKALFFNYQQGKNQFLTFKVLDDDLVKNDEVGEVTISADDFAIRRSVQELRLSKKEDNRATIQIQLA